MFMYAMAFIVPTDDEVRGLWIASFGLGRIHREFFFWLDRQVFFFLVNMQRLPLQTLLLCCFPFLFVV